MEVKNIETFNWMGALRGARNPMNSWAKNDTDMMELSGKPVLGPNDLDLAKRLCAAGPEHRKWMRQVFVSMDITAPMYWWSEMDTQKIGTTANSTSKMHKLASTPITINCFETDDMVGDIVIGDDLTGSKAWGNLLAYCELLRQKYLETKDIRYWKELLRILPNSWLQTRTWTGNYEILHNIYHQRKNHKLSEWHTFLDIIVKELPQAQEFIVDN